MNEIVITGDGSHTIFHCSLNEHYHSTFGAITESKHVFIRNGLHCVSKDPVTIFEVGFGSGLNAYLAFLDARQHKRSVTYYTIEKYPLDFNVVQQLNYPSLLSAEESNKLLFYTLHETGWEKPIAVTSFFRLYKIKADLISFDPFFYFDVVFYDAFAPDKQPEMWTVEIFRRLYNRLNPGGILTTYCVKGEVKRNLKEAGFGIKKIPGPPGKREMLKAIKLPSASNMR
ncbi:MAG: tRNA (5-methylaminomethyl-2-thiouridine)(34)-methyltransferase MnmD [Bacteroidales bacterium]|nr:tRNA (5-methylaminomethyl-2-thiouridine)(34)-methyltransferase MnmD [Bacteroidales bacterium]